MGEMKNIQISNITFKSEKTKPRVPVIAVNVDKLALNRMQVNDALSTVVLLDNVRWHEIDKK